MREALERLWYGPRPAGLARGLAAALSPFSWAYAAGLRLRSGGAEQRVAAPVVSVGNLSVGGNGKTPLAMELARMLLAEGLRPALVSRGYGRQSRGVRVAWSPGGLAPDWEQVGDEPALMARRCPRAMVVVGEDRVAAARLALEAAGADAIVCDDAFQHRALVRDLDLVAVHAVHGLGNGRLLPRGPLREPPCALARAHGVVFTHAPEDAEAPALLRALGLPAELPAVCLALEPAGLAVGTELLPGAVLPPGPILAASAIAHPEGFRRHLETLGCAVVGHVRLPDHHPLGGSTRERLERRARALGAAAIVVTEKDRVKLGPDGELPMLALRLEARWLGCGEAVVQGWLRAALRNSPTG